MTSSSATVRVDKATSDLLVGPDWTLNMDICDSINSDHWQAKDVVKVVKKRLQNKNPKVQFLALTLLETMIKNCGDYVHFHVVERDILQEMIKIVKKKTDMQVRDKILVLLDSWQEAFGGPGGKYPQYYWAYAELKRSGVEFPLRSVDEAPIFTPPVNHPTPRHPPAGYGMPSNSSVRLDEAMASEMANLSISDLDSIRSVMELLSDMLQAVNPNDRGAVEDEVIVDLVSQCRSNKNKLMHLITSTSDEELLGQGLALNDKIQVLLAKHDAIASGSPLPIEPSESRPTEPYESIHSLSAPTAPVAGSDQFEDDEEEDDGFSQLARRNAKIKPVPSPSTSAGTGNQEASPSSSDVTATTASSVTGASSFALSNALALPDPPTPVRTATKEQDMIDLLSITLSTNPSPPHTPLTPPSISGQFGSQVPLSPNTQGYPYTPQPYPPNQGFIPYNSYVAPWAQQALPQPVSQHPVQFPQYSSSYPPPPWATPANADPRNFPSATHQSQGSHENTAAAYVPSHSSRPLQQYNASGPGGNNAPTIIRETNANANTKQAGPATTPKPFVPSYRLFEDLIDLRHTDGGIKKSGTSTLSGSSNQSMVGGKR